MSFSSASFGMATPNPAGDDVPPVRFRFRPTDQEIITIFLGPKNRGQNDHDPVIADVEVCKMEPWDLPVLSIIKSNDPVWYFYCRRERKFHTSNRSSRTTKEGYWKPYGKARPIKANHSKEVIGLKRTLVFHHGRTKGTRTEWVMHEYECSPNSGLSYQGDFVLCKLKKKSDASDGYSISLSQSAILSGTMVDSTRGVADSLMVSAFENLMLDNQDGISSASVEVAWCPLSMTTSYTDYGPRNQYKNFDILDYDGLFASDRGYEEPEENSRVLF